MWARIDKNAVVEMTDMNPDGRFHPSIEWVMCHNDIGVGMTYVDGIFGPTPGPDLDRLAEHMRVERDIRLRTIYDVGVIMLQREERNGADVAEKFKILDDYAAALLDVPQQSGFPTTIIWPEDPVL
jgi:hypothetical protein